MSSPFDPQTGAWKIAWPGRVAKHDVVYLTPPDDPMHGMPLGNGEIGVLCWCEGSKLIMVINRSDSWDDASFGRFNNWKREEEEYSTTLRHGGRIILDLKLPLFDIFYLSDCEARISVADASFRLAVSGPFGSLSFRAFVCHDEDILCCEVTSKLAEPVSVEVTVERYGSRMFHHWYASVNSDVRLGLAGTDVAVDEDGAYVTHQLTSGTFALGCGVVAAAGANPKYTRESSHVAKCTLSAKAAAKFTLMATVSAPQASNPIKLVKKQLDAAQSRGAARLFRTHKRAWKAFWLRSLLESGDDYLDNLWHLTMYYANSSQRGRYPGRFIGGLWNWSRDFQAWGFYFHWNQQQTYWSLNAAGHHDLIESYLNLRWDGLPHAQEDARELFGVEGDVVSDVTERRGYNSADEFLNHTPVAQIALDFWRQYLYTGNLDFLRTRALPYILAAAGFFASLFEKGEDGFYHACGGTGYEGRTMLRDCVAELACARALFPAVIEALKLTDQEDPRAAQWQELLDNLAPFLMATQPPDVIAREQGSWRLQRGPFKGDVAPSNQTIAAGFGLEQNEVLSSFVPNGDPDVRLPGSSESLLHAFTRKLVAGENACAQEWEDMKPWGPIFPWVEHSVVFPSGLVGRGGADTALFKAAVNTVKLFATRIGGWDPLPIVLARLGLGRELVRVLGEWPMIEPLLANGTAAEMPENAGPEAPLSLRTHCVHEARPDVERQWLFPNRLFRHTGMEAPSVLACALNESLLQSYDGIIRVAPAVTPEQKARFTLHAVGGFVVSAEIENGQPLWIAVRSLRGRVCRVQNPWPYAYVCHNGERFDSQGGEILEFATESGSLYMIVPDERATTDWAVKPVEYAPNAEPKMDIRGVTTLGLPRMF